MSTNDYSIARSSASGVARSFFVHGLIYPLELVKTHQQVSTNHEKSYQIAQRLFRAEGWRVFYRGLAPQLMRTSSQQVWCWPVMTEVPPLLKRCSPIFQQGLTALTIATVSAFVTTPFEKLRVQRSLNLPFSWKKGWSGVGAHWRKLAVSWSAFLVSQHILRERCRASSGKTKLTLPQLTVIGLQVALIVSLAAAPFDVANTLRQSEQLSRYVGRRMFRGWPLSLAILGVHNTASVIVLDHLSHPNLSVR